MRDLSASFKLSIKSLGEVQESFAALISRLKVRGHTYLGRPITREQAVNALLLYLLDLPADQQEAVLSAGLRALRALQELPESGGAELADLSLSPSVPAGFTVESVDPAPSVAARKAVRRK